MKKHNSAAAVRAFWSSMTDDERKSFVAERAAKSVQAKRAPTPRYMRLPFGITHEQHAADIALLKRCKAECGL